MSKKNILQRIIAMVTALCIMIPLSAVSNIRSVDSANFGVIDIYNSWQEGYRALLTTFMHTDSYIEPYEDYSGSYYSSYTLCDLNNDDIPELIINTKPVTLAANYIYTFYNDQVVLLVDGRTLDSTISLCLDEQLIGIHGASGRNYFKQFARINNGKLEIVDDFNYGQGYYIRNGSEISKSQFEQSMSKYDAKNWEEVNIWNENRLDGSVKKSL